MEKIKQPENLHVFIQWKWQISEQRKLHKGDFWVAKKQEESVVMSI